MSPKPTNPGTFSTKMLHMVVVFLADSSVKLAVQNTPEALRPLLKTVIVYFTFCFRKMCTIAYI